MEKQKYICIDIGGTAIKYGLADELGNFIEKVQCLQKLNYMEVQVL